jgi:hypothetical protein
VGQQVQLCMISLLLPAHCAGQDASALLLLLPQPSDDDLGSKESASIAVVGRWYARIAHKGGTASAV